VVAPALEEPPEVEPPATAAGVLTAADAPVSAVDAPAEESLDGAAAALGCWAATPAAAGSLSALLPQAAVRSTTVAPRLANVRRLRLRLRCFIRVPPQIGSVSTSALAYELLTGSATTLDLILRVTAPPGSTLTIGTIIRSTFAPI
jgi:hypothetical protein